MFFSSNVKWTAPLVAFKFGTRKDPTYGKHQGEKLFATIDYESGEIYWEEHEKYKCTGLFKIFGEYCRKIFEKKDCNEPG